MGVGGVAPDRKMLCLACLERRMLLTFADFCLSFPRRKLGSISPHGSHRISIVGSRTSSCPPVSFCELIT